LPVRQRDFPRRARDAASGERLLGLDRSIDLILDGAVEIESFRRATAEVVERIAARRDRLRASRLEQVIAE
jgi:hypothetical protein